MDERKKEEAPETQQQPQRIKHKAEPTRHYPRYKIPAYIEIDGKRYKLNDWSVGGCAIADLPDEYLDRKWASGNLIVPFDTFETVIKDIKLEFLHRRPDGSVGCRFTELKPEQISLMQDIIEAYLEGNIVTLDEFINVIKREDLRETLEGRRPKPPKRGGREEFLRRVFVLSVLFSALTLLVIFLLEALHARVFIVKPVAAFYDAKLEIIRSPINGFFKTKYKWQVGDRVKKNQVIGVVDSPASFSVAIPSPVTGTVVEVYAKNLDVVRFIDPLLAVLPDGEEIYVYANILHKDMERVRVGQDVEIIRQDGRIQRGKIVAIEGSPSLATFHSITPLPAYSLSWNYDRVKIKVIDEEVPMTDLKKSVDVVIDLTPTLLKPIFWILP
jgi:alginate biosynthesis protein Alg44